MSDTDEPFRSGIRPELEKRTRALEELAVEMYARGLSTRDIEATFRGEDERSLLSRTAVSEVTEQLWEEYEAFATRDLSEFKLLYLFVDGVAERLHTGQRREMVLCAWGITDEGEKVLLHLSPGTKEDTASMKNVVRLENHYSPWELERALARFVEYYNHERLHEAIGNVTPDDMYHGRQRAILSRREKIKRLTLERRKKENLRNTA